MTKPEMSDGERTCVDSLILRVYAKNISFPFELLSFFSYLLDSDRIMYMMIMIMMMFLFGVTKLNRQLISSYVSIVSASMRKYCKERRINVRYPYKETK